MSEHKIIITLKPKQYEAIERLAKASGAKSTDAFVQQKLLSVLGLDNAQPPLSKPVADPDFQNTTVELRRLHAELKAFVAESLAGSAAASSASLA